MIWNHLPPPTQVSVGELCIQGIERQRGGGAIFHGRGCGGTQIIRQHRDCGTLYNICTVLYSLYRLGGPVEGKLFCALHKMMESGEIVLVYRQCYEDRSSEAAIGEGGGRAAARFAS